MRRIWGVWAIMLGATLLGLVASEAAAGPVRPQPQQATAQRLPSGVQLDRGMFLVADRGLQDPNFRETVVLLVRYEASGAMGLIVNRPTRRTLSDWIPSLKGNGSKGAIFGGGPVETNTLLMLVRANEPQAGARPVLDDVHVSRDPDLLRQLTEGDPPTLAYRLYAGYAGWAPGQLGGEVERGDWHVLPARSDFVFHEQPAEVWHIVVPPDPTELAFQPPGRPWSRLRHNFAAAGAY